jgi:hypothetical protein
MESGGGEIPVVHKFEELVNDVCVRVIVYRPRRHNDNVDAARRETAWTAIYRVGNSDDVPLCDVNGARIFEDVNAARIAALECAKEDMEWR